MSKKGFTLVELLAVIAIIALIALISVPAVSNTMNKQKEKLYYDQLNELVKASQNWATDNSDLLLNELGNKTKCAGYYTLTISDLKDGDENVSYLGEKFVNPKDEEQKNFGSETKVRIYKQGKNYLYCVDTPNCENAKYEEYKENAKKLCCNGSEFQDRLAGCRA